VTPAPPGAAPTAFLRIVLACLCMGLTGCATHHRHGSKGPGHLGPVVDCRGERTEAPTVILEAGSFGTSADWGLTLDELAKAGRVCAYDRLGLGDSPARHTAPNPQQIARDLALTLDEMGETQPVIVVGHSNGALYAETFAALFPDRVAGLAYVNGVGSDDLENPLVMADLRAEERVARLAVIGGRLGLAGLAADRMIGDMGLTGHAAVHKRRALTSRRHLAESRDEVLEIIPGLHWIKDQGIPGGDIPAAVVVSDPDPGEALDTAWRSVEVQPARRACQGWVLDIAGGSHVSPLGRDRSYLLAAVDWLRTPGLRADADCTGPAFKR
jgi:pimeloyl-ACP methyl ester carboxylesterase